MDIKQFLTQFMLQFNKNTTTENDTYRDTYTSRKSNMSRKHYTSSKNNMITYIEWDDFIKLNKIKLLNYIDKTSCLDNSNENQIFINNVKKILLMDIFNMSRISYLVFSFINIYVNKYLIHIIYPLSNIANNSLNPITLTLIEFITKLIIYIEFTLNLHLFIIVYLTYINTNKKLDNPDNHNILKPKILTKLEIICTDVKKTIKSSSIILLLLKINSKLCNILDNVTNDYISSLIKIISTIENKKNILVMIKTINNKMTILLDTFMLAIMNPIHNSNIKKYELCINYICDLANILYIYFDISFDIFINHLKEGSSDNKKLDITKQCIFSLLKNELSNLEEKLFET